MSDPTDKRKDPRVPLILRVEYPGAADFVRDCTENLSAGGMFIRTERDYKPGERIPLVVSFPGLLEPVQLEVRVVRRRPAGVTEPAGVAVEIPEDRAADRTKLEELAQAATRVARGDTSVSYQLLLVEDNPHVVEMYAYALKKMTGEGGPSVAVEFAGNGQEALDRLGTTPKIDLLITDLYMPVMDGFTFLEKIRADPAMKATPIIVISGAGSDARERATELGVDVYMQKPVKFLDIVQTVRTLLGLKR